MAAPHPSDSAEIARLIITNARDYAIITLDDEGVITSWSPGAELIFGYAAEEIIAEPSRWLFVAADQAAGAHIVEMEVAREHGRAEDSRWHQHKDGHRFWGNGVMMVLRDGPHAGFLKILRDETKSKLADQQRVLLLNELNHRIKNTLATVQSIAENTLRASSVDANTRANLTNRLIALSEAHNLLVAENWAGADLGSVVAQAVAPYEVPATPRFAVDGPPVRLSPQQAVSLSLTLHELATNAAKYGALSSAEGKVAVAWNVWQDGSGRRYLNLLWEERGGPPVAEPTRQGFGTRLITRTVGQESGGHAEIKYDPDGLRCVIGMELSREEEIPILDLSANGHRGVGR
jgi:PAS domain S-box-containing protein